MNRDIIIEGERSSNIPKPPESKKAINNLLDAAQAIERNLNETGFSLEELEIVVEEQIKNESINL